MLAQMLGASPQQSAAFDEGYTITYGYAYLRTGDARLSRGQNPPLTNVFIALPLLLRNDVAFPLDHPTWQNADIYGFTDEFLWKANVDRAAQLVLLARLPEMALALLLACTVFAFARSLFGNTAALIALFLCVFDPNILAHGYIAGTDLGVTLFLFGAVWVWTVALKRASLRYAMIAGLLTGAALATKYSAMWLAPILLVITLAYPGLHERWKSRLKTLIVLGLAAVVVIWGTFTFSIGPLAPGGLQDVRLVGVRHEEAAVEVGVALELRAPSLAVLREQALRAPLARLEMQSYSRGGRLGGLRRVGRRGHARHHLRRRAGRPGALRHERIGGHFAIRQHARELER